IELDTVGPVVAIDSPTSGTWYSEAVVFEWSTEASDLVSSLGLVLDDADLEFDATVFYGEQFGDEGWFNLMVSGMDDLGNLGPLAESDFGIDRTAPSITLDLQPIHSTPVIIGSGMATDNDGSGIAEIDVRDATTGDWVSLYTSDGGPLGGLEELPYSFELPVPVFHGSHTVQARAKDMAGNVSLLAEEQGLVDLEAPQVTITEPSAMSTLSGWIDIEADIMDDIFGVDLPTVLFRFNQETQPWQSLSLVSGNLHDGTYTFGDFDTWQLYDGETVLQVKAADVGGHDEFTDPQDTNPAEITVMIDNNYPPQAPTGLHASYVSYTEVEIMWNKNTEGDLSHYRLYRRVNDGASIGEGDLHEEPIYDTSETLRNSFTDDDIDPNTNPAENSPRYWDYAMKAVDDAGNMSHFSLQITVDPPNAPNNLVAFGKNGEVELEWNPVSEGFVKGYEIWRRELGTGDFTKIGSTPSHLDVDYTDGQVTNGVNYEYYVIALDGADNPSERSVIALATPNTTKTYVSYRLVMFEDLKHNGNIDWDFNDVGAEIIATHYLNENDGVTRLLLRVRGVIGGSGHRHQINIRIRNLAGKAPYTTEYWYSTTDPNATGAEPDEEGSGVIDPEVDGSDVIVLFEDSKVGSRWIHNDIHIIDIDIEEPNLNPLTGFDKVPFDMFMYSWDTHEHIFVYNPDTGQYIDENTLVTTGPLQGVYLNAAISIPVLNWTLPNEGLPIWYMYPEFIEYAKTYKTQTVKNPTWYERPVATEFFILEAEDYDDYYDKSPGNSGGAHSHGDIDIRSWGSVNAFGITDIEEGEWVEYHNVLGLGRTYTVKVLASSMHGSTNAKFTLKIGENYYSVNQSIGSGNVTITINNVYLAEGPNTIRVEMESDGIEIANFEFEAEQ
ncbi:MAG: hypothetical protein JJU11_12890, partial [Candidatus Sumerlaeia bacterium]|nr:hypothetical protein [Candidatus Sumerlaeia bacterium]